MIGKHPQADRILVAKISGEAKHHAKRRELTADEEAAAVAALRELAGGRADLRAEVCGVMEGASEGELHEPRMPPFSGGLHGGGVPRRAGPAGGTP